MIHGNPDSERREEASWRWWNLAVTLLAVGALVACITSVYAFWWLFL